MIEGELKEMKEVCDRLREKLRMEEEYRESIEMRMINLVKSRWSLGSCSRNASFVLYL